MPTPAELRAAADAAASGRSEDADRFAALLEVIADSGDPALTGLAEELLGAAGARLWLALDVSFRRISWYDPPGSAPFVRRIHGGELSLLGLVLAACERDGHVREAAVLRLSDVDHSAVLPVLAVRSTDWVAQVRDRARFACQRRLEQAPSAAFLAVAPVALALRGRHAGAWLASAVESLLRQGSDEVVTAGLTSGDRRTRRLAYTAGMAAGRLSLSQLMAGALTDDDLPIRVACAEGAIRSGDPGVPRELLRSRTSTIRAVAIHHLALAGDVEPAWNALLDRSPVVRATAGAALRRAGHEPADRYRLLVASQPPRPAALAGLGETGSASDIPVLRAFLPHPSVRVRTEAVRALRRLGDTPVDLLVPMLLDPAPVVTRHVVRSLRDQAYRIDESHLRELLDTRQPAHVRMAAFGLLHARDPWTRLELDLTLLEDPLQPLRDRVWADLGTLLARDAATIYSRPNPARARELTKLLARAKPILGKHQARQLMFHIGLGQ